MSAPTAEEKTALREFCSSSIQIREITQQFAEQRKEIAKQKRDLRNSLTAMIRDAGSMRLPDGQFVRLKVCRSYKKIRAATIEQAVANLEVQETFSLDDAAMHIYKALQKTREKTTDYADVSKSLPRGIDKASVGDATPQIQQLVAQYAELEQQQKRQQAEQRQALQGPKEQVALRKSVVQSYMNRNRLTAQRINLHSSDHTFMLRRKVRKRKPDNRDALLTMIHAALAKIPGRTAHEKCENQMVLTDALQTSYDEMEQEDVEDVTLDMR